MTSQLFRHALQPRILLRLFLAVLVLHLHGADALRRTRCKTSEDCAEPENAQFCDENFFACMPCDDYCTGAEDTIPICRQKCPIRYITVYGPSGRDKQPEVPEPDVPLVDPEPPKEPAPVSQNSKETDGINTEAIVVGCFFMVAVVAVVAGVILYRRYARKPDSRNGQGQIDQENTDRLLDEEKTTDEHKPDNDEDKPDKVKENEPENEDVHKVGQPDPNRSSQDGIAVNNVHATYNSQGQLMPNQNMSVEDVRNI